jgi:hypothetical protein
MGKELDQACYSGDPSAQSMKCSRFNLELWTRTSMTVRSKGLYRESSYSSSLLCFCLSLFLVSLSFGPYRRYSDADPVILQLFAYPAYSQAQMNQCIDRILFRHGQARVLVKSSTIFVRNAVTMLNVQRNDADFVNVPGKNRSVIIPPWQRCTYCTSRLSKSGTISSTRCLGVLPSAVRPVAQFCSTVATLGSLARSKIPMHSCAMLRCNENFSLCSWYCGRLASISFMSFRLAAPSLHAM